MKTKKFSLGLFAILILYSSLYSVTPKKLPPCDGLCEKISDVSSLVRKDRPYIYGVWQCRDSVLCVQVRDSVQVDWNALADTVCMDLTSQSLFHYRTAIITLSGDTLTNKTCP